MEPVLNPSDFGLHRGRRVLAAALCAVAVALGVWAFAPARAPSPPPAVAEADEVAPLPPPPLRAKAPAKPARRQKGARSAARAAPPRAVSVPAPAAVVPPPAAAEPAQPSAKPDWAVPPPEPEVATAIEPPPPMPPAEPAEAPAAPADDGNGEAIARAIANERRAAVRDCFERELKQDPKLNGTVMVELDLAPPNQVHAVRVNDDLDRPAFTACVATAMQHPRLAGLNEEVSVRVPYVLSAESK